MAPRDHLSTHWTNWKCPFWHLTSSLQSGGVAKWTITTPQKKPINLIATPPPLPPKEQKKKEKFWLDVCRATTDGTVTHYHLDALHYISGLTRSEGVRYERRSIPSEWSLAAVRCTTDPCKADFFFYVCSALKHRISQSFIWAIAEVWSGSNQVCLMSIKRNAVCVEPFTMLSIWLSKYRQKLGHGHAFCSGSFFCLLFSFCSISALVQWCPLKTILHKNISPFGGKLHITTCNIRQFFSLKACLIWLNSPWYT